MAKLSSEMVINVMDIDKVETLVELLSKYQEVLPSELKESLFAIADCEKCEIGHSEICSMGHDRNEELTNSAGIDLIISINPILRRVKAAGQPDMFPESFSLWSGDKLLVNW